MASICDQDRDTNSQVLWSLLNLYAPPQFVKTASADKVRGADSLPPAVYGDPAARLFPCHTGPATWVSALYFLTQKSAMDPGRAEVIESRIDKAASYHGIAGAVQTLKEAVAKNQKTSDEGLADEDYMLVYDTPAGKERHYRIGNAAEVKTAASYLRRHATEFSFADRSLMAEKVLMKAASLDVDDVPESVWLFKQAGMGICSAQTVCEVINERIGALRLVGAEAGKEIAQLEKIAQATQSDPAYFHVPSNLKKIAAALDRLDREYHLPTAALSDLAETLFQVGAKEAEDFHGGHVALVTGSLYARADLEKIGADDLRNALGSDFADEVTLGQNMISQNKLAEILPTLPRPEAEIFDSLLSRLGIQPQFKQAAAEPLLSDSRLVELASRHRPGA